MAYVIKHIQSKILPRKERYEVGYYKPFGSWEVDSEFKLAHEAEERCSYLNGGNHPSVTRTTMADLGDIRATLKRIEAKIPG